MIGKKGDEKVLSIYWFVILIIITIGIVSGTLHVFGSNTDIREAEAGLLKERIVDCLVSQGEMNDNFEKLESGNEASLLQVCKIDLKDNTEKYKDTQQYYAEINGKRFGGVSVLNDCITKKSKCMETKIYVLNQGKEEFLEIKTAVRKTEKNEN